MYIQGVIYGPELYPGSSRCHSYSTDGHHAPPGQTRFVNAVLLPFSKSVSAVIITADGITFVAQKGYASSRDAVSKRMKAHERRVLHRQQTAARSKSEPDGDVDLPRDSLDLIPSSPIKLLDRYKEPLWVTGLLDSGAMTMSPYERLKPKSRSQPDGLINSAIADKLDLPRSPYRGKALKGFDAAPGCNGVVPREQITVTWKLRCMKKPSKSILAIHDFEAYDCIIGINGIRSCKIWKWNSDKVEIFRKNGSVGNHNPRNSAERSPLATLSPSLDDSCSSSDFGSDSDEGSRRGLLDHHGKILGHDPLLY